MDQRALLAGDLGATHTRLAIVSTGAGVRQPLASAEFHSADHANLADLVQAFLSQVHIPVKRAVLGVPGPVVDGRARITNLPWTIDAEHLAKSGGFTYVMLLNDVQALGYALPLLEPEEMHTLNPGTPVPGAPNAVIAPGTGLGEAFVVFDGGKSRAYATEGGHTDFAPTDPRQMGLLEYLAAKFDHVSYERVCSGRGMPLIYDYLKESGFAEEPAWLKERLAAADDPNPVIVAAALQEPISALCRGVLDLFVSVLGAEAGNLALKVLATGGVYLGGGIPRRIITALDGRTFIDAFRRKGRLAPLLARIPVHVILLPQAALLGAATYGLQERA